MKLYLACTNNGKDMASAARAHRREGVKIKLLISYFYFQREHVKDEIEALCECPIEEVDIFADSGAYSAYSLGQPIRVQDYADWLGQWGGYFQAYSNLDVKGNVDAGLKNQQWLEDQGFAPLPVFHGGEPWSVLADMITRYPYIALGGIAGASMRATNPKTIGFLARCFEMAEGKSVFHGFGLTHYQVVKLFPWYSIDSSTWLSGIRFGNFPLFDERRGQMKIMRLGQQLAPERRELLRRYRISSTKLRKRLYHYTEVSTFGAQGALRLERWVNQYRKPVELPYESPETRPAGRTRRAVA